MERWSGTVKAIRAGTGGVSKYAGPSAVRPMNNGTTPSDSADPRARPLGKSSVWKACSLRQGPPQATQPQPTSDQGSDPGPPVEQDTSDRAPDLSVAAVRLAQGLTLDDKSDAERLIRGVAFRIQQPQPVRPQTESVLPQIRPPSPRSKLCPTLNQKRPQHHI